MGAASACMGCSLASCGDESISPVDFTLDISQPANAALQSVGGSLIKDQVIIARTSTLDFVALAKACTHQGTTLSYEPTNSRLHCSNHGSNFSLTGSVINGPASKSLQKFNTELTANILRIFS